MAVADNSYTHHTWLIVCGTGSLVESKWCHYVMVEADSHLKLLPASSYTYKVFEHINMLSIGIWHYPQIVIPTLLGSGFRVLGHLWSQNDVIRSRLRLTTPTQTASCIHIRHIKSVWALWYSVHGYKVAALKSYTQTTWLRFCGSGSLVESKWCHHVMVEAYSQL